MYRDPSKILIDSIKRLLRRGATSHLSKIVNRAHAADLSVVFGVVSLHDQLTLFNLLSDPTDKGVLISELDEDVATELIENLPIDEVVTILEEMPNDDVADLIGRLPEELSATILDRMHDEGSEEIEDLLQYENDTAGGIMVTEYIALREETTAQEAIESIRKEYSDVEMPFYLYVIDGYGKLVGVVSLRQLVVMPPEKPLKEFMTSEIVAVRTHTDQEEVAKIVERYDILAVPVVDDSNTLQGIVTVDDVIDILRREATEDILKMAGAGEEFVETKSIMRSTKIRLPWLFASFLGGIVAILVIGRFEDALNRYIYLAAFIPVIMGMGGNIGTQSSTIVVRGLATGRINVRHIWQVVLKELCIGAILGVIYGTVIGMVAQFQHQMLMLAVSVGMSLICSMSLAALVGSFVPLAFARVNIDPAVATGPFVTTAIDIISVFFYFQIATTLIGI